MANFFQRHLLIVLALTESLLVTSSDVDLCHVYKNSKGKISSSRVFSKQDRALHDTFLNKLRQYWLNTPEANVSSLTTLTRIPKTRISVRDHITTARVKTLDAESGQHYEEKKSLSPQRIPHSHKFRAIRQSNGLEYVRRQNNHTPRSERGQHFRDDDVVGVKKGVPKKLTLISSSQGSPSERPADCHLNRCEHDLFSTASRHNNQHGRFSNVADEDTSRYRTLQEAREYLLKENAMNARKNMKTFRFGKKRKSAKSIEIDNRIMKPENQTYDRKPTKELDLLQSAGKTKQRDGPRPFNLRDFLEQDPQLAQHFSRLPKNRLKFRYGKRIHKVMLRNRPSYDVSKL